MPIEQSVTLKETVKYLNELIALDANAMRWLAQYRVVCNDEFADHPTVQVGRSDDGRFFGRLALSVC